MSDSSSTTPSPSTDRDPVEKPLTIVIGADTFPPNVNGAARFVERLAAGLVRRGHDVHIVAPAASRKHGTFQETHDGATMTVHRLFSLRWPPHDWLRFALPVVIQRNAARILDEVKPDVVHSNSHLIVGRGLSMQAAKRGIRIVATNHLMPENMMEFTVIPKWSRGALLRWAWRQTRAIIGLAESITTPTQKAADFLEKNTGLTGVHPISCGIDAELYTPSFAPRTENRILFVGRVTGEKHIDVLIRALGRLPQHLDAKLTIVGGGDQKRNLEVLAEQLGLADRVTFAGYVSEDELRASYTRASVFAMPSIAELQSIATMEAMASGLPVVGADAMALPHLIHDGENGFLFRPGDIDDLAAKLSDVLEAGTERLDGFKNESLRLIQAHVINRTLSTFESLYRGEKVTDASAEHQPEQARDEA